MKRVLSPAFKLGIYCLYPKRSDIILMANERSDHDNIMGLFQLFHKLPSETPQHIGMVCNDDCLSSRCITPAHGPCAALNNPIAPDDGSKGSKKAFYIESNTHISDIITIEFCLFRYFQFITTVYLSPARQARLNIVSSVLIPFGN